MYDDIIHDAIETAKDYNVTDWEKTAKEYFSKYLISEKVFSDNIEALQINVINYIRLQKNKKYFDLFEWTISLFQDTIHKDKIFSLNTLNGYLSNIYETDFKWTSMINLQKPIDGMDTRDLITYKFSFFENILENMFRYRFELLYAFAYFLESGNIIDTNNITFGELIKSFPVEYINYARFYLQDPLFSISTNQWRNISAHKTVKIEMNSMTIYFGKNNKYKKTLSFNDFDNIAEWIFGIYNAIRLAEIIIYFNYSPEIDKLFGLKVNTSVRLDTFIFEMVFNMKNIGFKFVATSQTNKTFSLIFEKRQNDTLQYSLMLVSQCLERIAYYISLDNFNKEKYTHVCAKILETSIMRGSVKVDIQTALDKVYGKITFEEYVDSMVFNYEN
jgi:hypothetical protein